jgi:cell division initiation protein
MRYRPAHRRPRGRRPFRRLFAILSHFWADRTISIYPDAKARGRLAVVGQIGQNLPDISGDGFPDPRFAGRKATPMMNSPAARLTAREIIAKTFSAKSRRGYDPAEVDAYLMDVARQVDELNLEIDRLTNEVVRLSFGQPASSPAHAPVSSAAPLPEAPLPPPPPPVAATPPPAPAPAPAMAATSNLAAEEESLKLILKAAQKTAEQAIVDARTRAEEILNEARLRASEITRESDRKAFEASSRMQSDLAALEDQIGKRRGELEHIGRTVESERGKVRSLALDLLRTVGEPAPAGVAGARAAVAPVPPVPLEPPPVPSQEPVVLDLTDEDKPATATAYRNDFDSYAPFNDEH